MFLDVDVIKFFIQTRIFTRLIKLFSHSPKLKTYIFSIYTLSDLGVLSNLIGSLSLANEHYSPLTKQNKMAGVNA